MNDLSTPVSRLRLQTEMYKLVTEITHDALWEWDFKNKELFWIDGGHKRLFGYEIENSVVTQAFWESLVHPDDLKRVLSGLKKIITEATGTAWEEHYRFKKTNGEFAFVHDRGRIIYDSNKDVIRIIGATQDVTEKILAENKLAAERKSRLKEVTAAVLYAQEKERASMGIELQENLYQVLAIAAMYVQMAKSSDSRKDIYLEESKLLISTVITKISAISKSLIIPEIHIIGLFENIKNLIKDQMEVHPFKVEFKVKTIHENEMGENLQRNIFRIIQEQMNNIIKHADASHVVIKLSKQANNFVLAISDDGIGCEVSKAKHGVGIINIQSRVDLYDGSIAIVSKPGEGYLLKVLLPIKNHTNDFLD